MNRSIKVAISLPDKDFQELEAYRKKEKVSRSTLILAAIRLWKESKEKERLIKKYEEGYRRLPEKSKPIEGWEKASTSNFSQGDW